MTRLLGATVAVVLLVAHTVTHADVPLALGAVAWTAITLGAFGGSIALRGSPAAWAVDTIAALGLVLLSGDWRSPFYVFALTTLVLPATTLSWRQAVSWSVAFSAAYALTAILTRQVPADTLANTIRLETLATHLLVPVLIALALAYAGALLTRLGAEQQRSERLAVQAERQRIAWELHDSAKQRVHAAHLLVSALPVPALDAQRGVLEQALAELRGATADMETSIGELRSPAEGRPVDELLRERAAELAAAGGVALEVHGDLPRLPPIVAAHAYRIVSEALTNAVRHAQGSAVRVTLGSDTAGARIVVDDDGVGMDHATVRTGQGLRSMHGRAETIGARLAVGHRPDGHGTRVELLIPTPDLTEVPDDPHHVGR